ncbi:hypothetical protein BOTBODRAFT_424383 [Botryobasidium botryosum FD-172 SS1]|uniref:Uncharacterized protein n=1 Tax=Botryobasidium botryosum (strain FD-172 SS1) TaxID=930990 RepID=A0A067M8J0_BOTB1|nr:hypothetical protein BOTBODRAFT_424383 [Botryobasidium botryosum FD-172 SS1]
MVAKGRFKLSMMLYCPASRLTALSTARIFSAMLLPIGFSYCESVVGLINRPVAWSAPGVDKSALGRRLLDAVTPIPTLLLSIEGAATLRGCKSQTVTVL